MPTVKHLHHTRKPQKPHKASETPVLTAEEVREMLLDITYALHATRVVGRKGEPSAKKER